MDSSTLWAKDFSYPPRKGNAIDILIDGEAAYAEIAAAFNAAREFIYLTISFGTEDFMPVPETGETLFEILRFRQKEGIDVRMVIWEPALKTQDTIPDPSPQKIAGVNGGPGSIQARWDHALGYHGWYRSPHNYFKPFYVMLPAELGCHHQKTYVMDDGKGGYLAFVGGINPVQAYWDTPRHDLLDVRRVEKGKDPLKGLEDVPPLHDIFYKIKGPAVADVLANFVERYNGASIPHRDMTTDVVSPVNADQIPQVANGIEAQIVRTIAPDTYRTLPDGDRSLRELYSNALETAGQGDLIYIEDQYFFDHGIVSEIHEAAERGAKAIIILTSSPDEGSFQGEVESILEKIGGYEESLPVLSGHENVGMFTLGNYVPDPRKKGVNIISETYIHSKTMAVIGQDRTIMTGGSGNIAFTSMWFHSEMNIALIDADKIKNWVARLWSEHLGMLDDEAAALIANPEDALKFFRIQAAGNKITLEDLSTPVGHVFEWGTKFPPRNLAGIDPNAVLAEKPGVAKA